MAEDNHGDETSEVVKLDEATLVSIKGVTSKLQEAQRAAASRMRNHLHQHKLGKTNLV